MSALTDAGLADTAMPGASTAGSGVELSIVVPTFNELLNLPSLLEALEKALAGIEWEVVVVDDDSTDGTAELARAYAARDRRIRCLHRIGRRGLASACIEGMLAASAPVIAVMDADMQHDERKLPAMLEALRAEEADIVVGSRYVAGGSQGDWAASRVAISRLATRLGRLVLRAELSDPMSGFFMLKRQVVQDNVRKLSGVGFKILFDLFASAHPPLRFVELPYEFRSRHAGASKLDVNVVWEYLLLLLGRSLGRRLPLPFLSFCLVGGFGAVIHLSVLGTLHHLQTVPFVVAQAIATYAAMTSNFLCNNALTYSDRRLHGWRLLKGWLSFVAICSFGAAANVGVAGFLFSRSEGWLVSALGGIVVGTVWNYAVSRAYTWKASS